jgi:hypothetical protein
MLLGTVAATVVILVVVALAQSSELAVPTRFECRGFTGALAHCLNAVASERRTALTFAWIGVAALVAAGGWLLFSGSRLRERRGARPALVRGLTSAPERGVGGPSERSRPAQGGSRGPAHEVWTTAERNDQLVRDRALLVKTCIAVRELVESAALREQLDDALTAAGVAAVQAAPGEPFNPAQYRAIGTVPTTDSALHDMVASTQRTGYADRGKRLSYPEVLVYNAGDEGKR